jgi:hypothetical protein
MVVSLFMYFLHKQISEVIGGWGDNDGEDICCKFDELASRADKKLRIQLCCDLERNNVTLESEFSDCDFLFFGR